MKARLAYIQCELQKPVLEGTRIMVMWIPFKLAYKDAILAYRDPTVIGHSCWGGCDEHVQEYSNWNRGWIVTAAYAKCPCMPSR